ncbi:DUF4178 domain-containing protein [Flavobacterium hungaricum]|uniref:DUF4178 domain-containing protein n=1 Tax=Flavobacterium hungaricum TaxID=2082725 RepID=A0ABR9TIN1_9FLAO|nr:DUF4178 domain-containing protein [Flavobacterium hungaricum]MBE8725125.1 DUF4178 domain-containing protein [Flavobacterium hungaricum]
MKIPCYICNTETELEVGFEVVNFACPNCHSVYEADQNGKFLKKSQYKTTGQNYPLQIGDVGFLKGSNYKVTGILRKNVHPDYTWTEFILQNEAKEFLYLSLSSGHWMMLTQMEEIFEVQKHPLILEHNNEDYNIFEFSDAKIISAEGFFDFELSEKFIHLVEYIKPPYLISVERVKGIETAFYGEYVKKEVIKKAFKKTTIPYQFGVNMIQPFRYNVRNTGLIFCFFALFIFTADWLLYKDQTEQKVFSDIIRFTEFDNKAITSASFVLNGASAPLTVEVSSSVDNSWANVNIALINEDTSDEIYANKDIEYYSGYTDGEYWNEGSKQEKFNICGVKGGKYHLVITPMKAPEDLANNEMQISATWNQPSSRNAWFVTIFMIVVFAVIYFFKYSFEKSRWSDSSYSPYSE